MSGIRYKGQIFSGAASFGSANDVAYDNTQSGLTAGNVQDALDELTDREDFYSVSESTNITFAVSEVTRMNNTDGLTCFKYANGMKRVRGLINVSATTTGGTDGLLFTVPQEYAKTSKDGSQQGWFCIHKVGSSEQSIIRAPQRNFFLWTTNLTSGIWVIDFLYA